MFVILKCVKWTSIETTYFEMLKSNPKVVKHCRLVKVRQVGDVIAPDKVVRIAKQRQVGFTLHLNGGNFLKKIRLS